MQRMIPCFYAEYGRYTNKFRAIPSNIDALKPVERRVLYGLYTTAKKHMTKSAKVIGYVVGNLHPHGDMSTYGTLHQLVIQKMAEGQGNWGGYNMVEDDKPAAYRYTEVRLSQWVKDLAFKYIDFAPFANIEYEDEPLFLPSPIPIGLIGYDFIFGVGVGSNSKVLTPRYTISDLASRLHWLLTKQGDEPVIIPNLRNCRCDQINRTDFKDLLTKGCGSLRLVPNGTGGTGEFYILGRVPGTNLSSLVKACEDKKLDITTIDQSGQDDPYSIKILVKPNTKKQAKQENLSALVSTLWQQYLIKTKQCNCVFVDDEGKNNEYGIDDILLKNFNEYANVVLKKRLGDFKKLQKEKFNTQIISIVRSIIEKHKCNKVSEIVQHFNSGNTNNNVELEFLENDNTWQSTTHVITEDDIRKTCNTYSIKKLVEVNLDTQQLNNDINTCKIAIKNTKNDCITHVKDLI